MRNYVQVSKYTHKKLHAHKLGPVHAHRTEGVTGYKGREGAYGAGGRIRVGGVNGDENGVGGESGDGDGDGERGGAGTRTGAEASEETQDVDEQRMGAGTGGGTETRALTEMRTGTRIGSGTGSMTGSERLEERRINARNRTRVVADAMWETGET